MLDSLLYVPAMSMCTFVECDPMLIFQIFPSLDMIESQKKKEMKEKKRNADM